MLVVSVPLLQVHFSINDFLGIRVILRGKLGFYDRSEVLEKQGRTNVLYMLALNTGLCLAILGPSSSY